MNKKEAQEYYQTIRDRIAQEKAQGQIPKADAYSYLPESQNYNPHVDITLTKWSELSKDEQELMLPQLKPLFRTIAEKQPYSKVIQREVARQFRLYISSGWIACKLAPMFGISIKNQITGLDRKCDCITKRKREVVQ